MEMMEDLQRERALNGGYVHEEEISLLYRENESWWRKW
jgi:hypothetical protein